MKTTFLRIIRLALIFLALFFIPEIISAVLVFSDAAAIDRDTACGQLAAAIAMAAMALIPAGLAIKMEIA